MRVALAQIDTTVGALDENARRVLDAYREARARGADLVVAPELALCGYPPLDLAEDPAFLAANRRALESLAARVDRGGALLVGFLDGRPPGVGKSAYNAAALLADGGVRAVRWKSLLPTYDVFDEARYFEPAPPPSLAPVAVPGGPLAVTVCEDIWNDADFWHHRLYPSDPVGTLVAGGARAIVNLSASPYWLGKGALRERMCGELARKHGRPVLLCNAVGGNDSLLFDGRSLVVAPDGTVRARGATFAEDLVVVDLEDLPAASEAGEGEEDEVQVALSGLVLGVRDYCRKTGFRGAVVGLSGGIDSAVTAAIAVRALGTDAVLGVTLPSPYSSEGSWRDSQDLAARLGIPCPLVPIGDLFDGFRAALAPLFAGLPEDVTEENLQARIRGTLLMAVSNKTGRLLLTTGNKSEMAVGYCTLYGDMSGGLAPIADCTKTLVYALADRINRDGVVIPASVLSKPPSAELRPGQMDQDTLPPYDVLDPVVVAYVEERLTPEEIAARTGAPRHLVDRVVRMIDASEYKRRQAAPGLKVTPKAFGPGRRLPIAARVQRE